MIDFLLFSTPTKDQRVALDGMEQFVQAVNEDDFLILKGAAGTGKTSMISALVAYLNTNKIPYKIAAPTGRAARIISKKTNSHASTVHAMIFVPEQDVKNGGVKFKLKIPKDENQTIYIVDESSMIPSEDSHESQLHNKKIDLLTALISYVKGGNEKNKIFFLGDTYQLPPVMEQESKALSQLHLENHHNLKGKCYSLSEVKRQEDGGYILENATQIRNTIEFGGQDVPIAGEQVKSIYDASFQFHKHLLAKGPEDAIALALSNKANKFFNDLVRNHRFGRNSKIIEVGDILLVSRNWNRGERHLYNGDQVELLAVEWSKTITMEKFTFVPVKVKPLFGKEVIEDLVLVETILSVNGSLDWEQEKKLIAKRYLINQVLRETGNLKDDPYLGALRMMHGYSVTCHKAQGGEWNSVYINTLGVKDLRWKYTAVTRGVDRVVRF